VTVSPSVLLLSIAIGVPLMLLALQVRGDLTRQRAALRQMMSDNERVAVMTPEPAMVSGAPIMPTPVSAPEPVAIVPDLPLDRTSGELRTAVTDLAAEGLSDRAIARRLRIGLEEVRLARASTIQPRQM